MNVNIVESENMLNVEVWEMRNQHSRLSKAVFEEVCAHILGSHISIPKKRTDLNQIILISKLRTENQPVTLSECQTAESSGDSLRTN